MRRTNLVVTSVVLGVVAILLLGGSDFLYVEQRTAQEGASCTGDLIFEQNSTLWTPLLVVESPLHGWGRALASSLEGGQSLNLSNGEAAGLFAQLNWTLIGRSVEPNEPNPGMHSCTTSYEATTAVGHASLEFGALLPAGSSDDSNVSTTWSPTSSGQAGVNTSVRFAITYDPAGAVLERSCGTASPVYLSSYSTGLTVSVPILRFGVTYWATGHLGVPTTFTYELPANGGTWSVDDTGETTGTGLAFDYLSACS